MTASLTPLAYADKWRRSRLKETSADRENFIDLCRLLGHPTPAEADPAGSFFTFQAGASKISGGEGFADVWYRGHFAWEYKGKHKDLDAAYAQLLQYREALENPPLLIVSDFERIIIHTNFTNTVKRTYEITLDGMVDAHMLDLLRKAFTSPDELRAPQTSDQVTREAAGHFTRLADLLRRAGHDPLQIAHFLIRLLFCLFAEDVDLLPARLFSRLAQNFRNKPRSLAAQLNQLFQAMASGGGFGTEDIPYIDGRLFDDARALELDGEGVEILIEVARLDWSSIEPSIFGTLFERGLDPGKRSQLGAHYTSREDILLIVEPVLMAPLRREWEQIQPRARALAAERDAIPLTFTKKVSAERAKKEQELRALLVGFAERIAAVQVLDPACGSGNFLYIALRQLLDLQKEVITLAGELQMGAFLPTVSPAQLHGIEINVYAHQLAQATIWIGYIQWLRENGYGAPEEPILKPLDNILNMDAILAYDADGRPLEPDWPAADVIISNPPFLGASKIRSELGQKYQQNLFDLYGNRLPAVDLVCYWFEKSLELLEKQKSLRVGLLATQAIRGGANRTVLMRIVEKGKIFWAQSDRDWVLNGASVHVSMIAFDKGFEKTAMLNDILCGYINPNLTSGIDITKAIRLPENYNISYSGTKKGGGFDITSAEAKMMLSVKGNPNGKSNADVVKPWLNGIMITNRTEERWIIDFGVDTSEEEACQYEKPFEYVKRNVYPERINNNRARRKELWWLHSEVAKGFRIAVKNLNRFIATPRVSKHRIFIWVKNITIPDDGVFIFARSDDYFFGILHSKVHELWSKATGTQLREFESGFRYTPTTTFETFPFPWPPGKEPAGDARVLAVAEAARDLVEKRDAWLNPPGASAAELKKRTLTNLYNQRPTWLELAHRRLDRAVFAAYGWPDDLPDEEILARLLALNLERAGK